MKRRPGQTKAERQGIYARAIVGRLLRTRDGTEPFDWGLADEAVGISSLVFTAQKKFIPLVTAARLSGAEVAVLRTTKYVLGRLVEAKDAQASALVFADFMANRGNRVLLVGVMGANQDHIFGDPDKIHDAKAWPWQFGTWVQQLGTLQRRQPPADLAIPWAVSLAQLPLPSEL